LTTQANAARYRQQGIWKDQTLWQRFHAAATRHAGKTAVVEKSRTHTYGQVIAHAENLAGNLLKLGLALGEVVAIQSKNAIELALVNLACSRAGLLFLPLHDSWREVELGHLLKLGRVSTLVTPGLYRGFDHGEMVERLRPELPALRNVYALEPCAGDHASFAELLQPSGVSPAELDARTPDADLPANIMLSGGTTSISKMSRYSANNLLVMLDCVARGCEFGADDVTCAIAPAGTGATGYLFPILMPLLHGATSVILERWSDPAEAVDLVARHRCTYPVGVPTQLTLMIPHIEKRDPNDFRAVRSFFSAGSSLPYETGSRIEQLMGCAIQTAYGTTDAGVPVCTGLKDPQEERLRSVGRVLPGFECELWDPATGERLEPKPGVSGEVVWRGPGKSWGYLGPQELTDNAFTPQGWFKSGDLGEFDGDGYLHIVGRSKDMILRGSRNIYPRTIEELLIRHPAVLDVSVAAMPDPILGEKACAFVVLRPGGTLTFQEMVEFLKGEKIAVWQLPERLEIMDELPRGVGGKVLKSRLTTEVTEKLRREAAAAKAGA
jgi:non-ribosomal peptide synthetase component E (peptide arylation enzyme)